MSQPGQRLRRARREPRQDRSREMVEKIIAATHSVLVERGYEGASTNRIADAAGISPGSFYQYFPDKHAVLDVVIERYAARMRARITDAFVSTQTETSVEAAVRRNVIALVEAFEENAALLRVLTEQLPRAADARRSEFTHHIDELLSAFLRFRQQAAPAGQPAHEGPSGPSEGGAGGRAVPSFRGFERGAKPPLGNTAAVAWVLVRAVENLTISYVLDPPPVDRDTIINEITVLLTGYLTTRPT